MKCMICKIGDTRPGKTTITLERDNMTLVFKGVPAEICGNCGEAYIDEQTTKQVLQKSEEAALSGVQVDVRHFAAA
jgi:YgiT-type zinc finger domain-containing protein